MRMHLRSVALAAVSASLLAASGWGASSAFGASQQVKKDVVFNLEHVAGAKGLVLVEGKGLVVYTFVGDKKGKAGTCSGGCAAIWPLVRGVPVVAHGVKIPGKFSTIKGQVTYNGLPLYLFTKEKSRANHADSGFKVVPPKASAPAPKPKPMPTSTGGSW
jgi:predicted lipoprotein with Yx(FWY)xxD motif